VVTFPVVVLKLQQVVQLVQLELQMVRLVQQEQMVLC
jgi:hypothetical protein